jgi:hypothetical protein
LPVSGFLTQCILTHFTIDRGGGGKVEVRSRFWRRRRLAEQARWFFGWMRLMCGWGEGARWMGYFTSPTSCVNFEFKRVVWSALSNSQALAQW